MCKGFLTRGKNLTVENGANYIVGYCASLAAAANQCLDEIKETSDWEMGVDSALLGIICAQYYITSSWDFNKQEMILTDKFLFILYLCFTCWD